MSTAYRRKDELTAKEVRIEELKKELAVCKKEVAKLQRKWAFADKRDKTKQAVHAYSRLLFKFVKRPIVATIATIALYGFVVGLVEPVFSRAGWITEDRHGKKDGLAIAFLWPVSLPVFLGHSLTLDKPSTSAVNADYLTNLAKCYRTCRDLEDSKKHVGDSNE